MEDLKVLAINSFPIHGMAGLKTTLSILGQRVLPVPSVLLNGLTNMPYVEKCFPDFKELLHGTFRLVVHRNQKVILSIGYIGLTSQVDVIVEVVRRYKNHIHSILMDPISGDHGKTYVPDEIIARLPELIQLSDYVFPNMTELRLITGFSSHEDQDMSVYVRCFQKKYTGTGLIVTSFKTNVNNTGVLLVDGDTHFQYQHSQQSRNYSGTGDAFMSYFILYHIYNAIPIEESLQQASDKIGERILNSIETDSDELII